MPASGGHFTISQTLALDWKPPLPISCSTLYHMVLLCMIATAKTLALQRYDITEKNVVHSSSETMNYLELVVHTLSDRCQELMYFPQIFKAFPSTLLSLLQRPGCLGSLSGNQKANQLHQIRFFFSATVSQKYELGQHYK